MFYFKQIPLNTKQIVLLPHCLIDGGRLLSVVIGLISFSVDKPLDFHDAIFTLSPGLSKV